MTDYRDLEEKGYLVIRNFASAKDVEKLVSIYKAIGNKVWEFPMRETMNHPGLGFFKDRCLATCAEIASQTDVNCDVFSELSWFERLKGEHAATNWQWHQDVIGYHISPSVYDYLNFFMPIIKTDGATNNLSLIPMDSLRKRHIDAYHKLLGKGFPSYKLGESQVFTDHVDDKAVTTIPNIDELTDTPTLNVGDMLIIRGDVIHKTQNVATERVAISYRFRNSDHMIRRSEVLGGGLLKLLFMYNHKHNYNEILAAFRLTETEEMSMRTFATVLAERGKELDATAYNTTDEFFKLLFFSRTQAQVKGMFREIEKRIKWGLFDAEELRLSEKLMETKEMHMRGTVQERMGSSEYQKYRDLAYFADAL